MEIEIFTLCDAATEQNGKLNIIGTFDTIHGAGVPLMHGPFALALRIRFSRIEFREHHIAIHFVDDDGAPVLPPLEGTINVQSGTQGRFGAANLILNFQKVLFSKFGEYAVDLALDGEQKAHLPIVIMEAKP